MQHSLRNIRPHAEVHQESHHFLQDFQEVRVHTRLVKHSKNRRVRPLGKLQLQEQLQKLRLAAFPHHQALDPGGQLKKTRLPHKGAKRNLPTHCAHSPFLHFSPK